MPRTSGSRPRASAPRSKGGADRRVSRGGIRGSSYDGPAPPRFSVLLAQRLASPRKAGHPRALARAEHAGDLRATETANRLEEQRLAVGERQHRHELRGFEAALERG